uniref:Uncharacterized protein n=1 Tax=Lepeophtheirus salmonis TaxID=72036 RepID=A0A0K2TM70_LEPSM
MCLPRLPMHLPFNIVIKSSLF